MRGEVVHTVEGTPALARGTAGLLSQMPGAAATVSGLASSSAIVEKSIG